MNTLHRAYLLLPIFLTTTLSASNDAFSKKLRPLVDDLLGTGEFQVWHMIRRLIFPVISCLLPSYRHVQYTVHRTRRLLMDHTVWIKKVPTKFSDIFPKRLGIFSPIFTRLLHGHIYAGLPIFIHLLATLTKLCHIKRDHHNCSKCPPSTETHARW